MLTAKTSNSYIDNGVTLGGALNGTVKHKIRVKEKGNNLSSFANVKTFAFGGINKMLFTEDEAITEFTL